MAWRACVLCVFGCVWPPRSQWTRPSPVVPQCYTPNRPTHCPPRLLRDLRSSGRSFSQSHPSNIHPTNECESPARCPTHLPVPPLLSSFVLALLVPPLRHASVPPTPPSIHPSPSTLRFLPSPTTSPRRSAVVATRPPPTSRGRPSTNPLRRRRSLPRYVARVCLLYWVCVIVSV